MILHELLFNLLEIKPEPEEMDAVIEGREDREKNGIIPHEEINWD